MVTSLVEVEKARNSMRRRCRVKGLLPTSANCSAMLRAVLHKQHCSASGSWRGSAHKESQRHYTTTNRMERCRHDTLQVQLDGVCTACLRHTTCSIGGLVNCADGTQEVVGLLQVQKMLLGQQTLTLQGSPAGLLFRNSWESEQVP